ncbi:MAG: TlpA family protein disulfide reductase [Myxococcota bacterium]
MRHIAPPLFALLVLCLGLCTASAEEPKPTKKAPILKVGQIAPSFLLKAMNPKAGGLAVVSTKKLAGSTATDRRPAIVLSFGAWYCGPCKKELPELKTFAERNKARGVLVTEVIIDKEPESVALMRKLTIDELKLPFPVVHDRFGIVSRRYGATELPYTVVLDGDRVVRWIHSGFTPDAMKKLQHAVDQVLDTGSASDTTKTPTAPHTKR